MAARRRSFEVDAADKENEGDGAGGGGNEDKGEAAKWRQRKTMFR